MTNHTIGIDTAKEVFHVVIGDRNGRPQRRRKLRRQRLAAFMAQQPPAEVFLEACAGSHDWARRLTDQGHRVRQIAPQFVRAYRKEDKNDFHDAAACIEAGLRPTMRFVGTKTVAQQELQAHQRVRSLVMSQRNALGNQLRGILYEFGLVVPKSIAALKRRVPEILEDGENGLPGALRTLVAEEYDRWRSLCARVEALKSEIERLGRQHEPIVQLRRELPGVGPLAAAALWTAVADARVFRRGRQFAAYVGLVPRQHSTGGRPRLLGIKKGGQCELRVLLIHGARSVLSHLGDKQDALSCWLRDLIERRGFNKAAVALANKNARQAWAILNQMA